jgi:hypothetical protein
MSIERWQDAMAHILLYAILSRGLGAVLQGASIPAVRPGRQTAEYVTQTLTNMSVLGSVFLGALAAAPSAVLLTAHPPLPFFLLVP